MANRTMQPATCRLFKSISNYASRVPIVLVATQKDVFLNNEFQSSWKELRDKGRSPSEDLEIECKELAEDKLTERARLIEEEMRRIMKDDSRMETCVPVSRGEDAMLGQGARADLYLTPLTFVRR
jgi:hypothetical protein